MEPPRHTLCHTLAKWLVLRLAFRGKLTKPEEIEALSVQMFVAPLTKKQDKHLVHIRPHVAARGAWNEAVAARRPGSLAGTTFRDLGGPRSDGLRRTQASKGKGRKKDDDA